MSDFLAKLTPEQRAEFNKSVAMATMSENPFVAGVGAMAAAALIPTYSVSNTAPELFAALTNEHRFLLFLGSKLLAYSAKVASDQAVLLEELRAKLHGWAQHKAPMPADLQAAADLIATLIDTVDAMPNPAKEAIEMFGPYERFDKAELRAIQERFEKAHGIVRGRASDNDETGIGG